MRMARALRILAARFASLIRAIHVTELRSAIDTLRVRQGLAAFGWTDAAIAELRAAVLALQ
jgi:hypothetical protein